MNGTAGHHFERNEPSSKSQILHVLTHVESRSKILLIIIRKMGREYKRGTMKSGISALFFGPGLDHDPPTYASCISMSYPLDIQTGMSYKDVT
jgi:hypothetical protein